MSLIRSQGVEHNTVLLLVSDAAPHIMVKTGSATQIFFPKMLYVTCLVDALHYIVKQIHSDFLFTYLFGPSKVFLKCLIRIQIFKDEAPQISLPLEPVITRRGTYLNAATNCCD